MQAVEKLRSAETKKEGGKNKKQSAWRKKMELIS